MNKYKYIVVNQGKGIIDTEFFTSAVDATNRAKYLWGNLTKAEKKYSRVYSALVFAEDLEEDGDWETFNNLYNYEGDFDSEEE